MIFLKRQKKKMALIIIEFLFLTIRFFLKNTRAFYQYHINFFQDVFNPLNAELNPICHLIALF